jgi:hypothetical protein
MRILRVAQYPEVPGGGTYHVHALSRDKAAMGHDIPSVSAGLPRCEECLGNTVVVHVQYQIDSTRAKRNLSLFRVRLDR